MENVSEPIINDVLTVFTNIGTEATVFKFNKNDVEYPDGGHMQGIQQISDALFISGSSKDKAYLLCIDKTSMDAINLFDISTNITQGGGTLKLKHAGGFQAIGNYMVIGIEGGKKDGSVVNLYDTSGTCLHELVERSKSDDGSGTAGAVGIVKQENDKYVLIVGSWDCDKVDIYESDDLVGNPEFTLINTWNKDDANKDDWFDKNWGKYQSLNLVQDENGTIYMFAFNRSHNRDFADLYTLDISKVADDVNNCIKKITNKHVTCKSGASFRYGGGIHILDSDTVNILATERDLHDHTSINQF